MDNAFFRFSDRREAGQLLADRIAALNVERPVIYALPRGGVPVAVEIANRLDAPLDLILVRKIGAPGNPELALGAIVEGANAQVVINEDVKRMSGSDMDYLERAYADQLAELARRKEKYLGSRPRINPAGQTVVVVDDGLATGASMKAALIALGRNGAKRIIVALPVAPREALAEIEKYADDIICLQPAVRFGGVGSFYRDFRQLNDAETVSLLGASWSRDVDPAGAKPPRPTIRRVEVPPQGLAGELVIPPDPRGLVIFAHGSGSSRRSPRNTFIATKLNSKGFATLQFDLLTPAEGLVRRNIFDIPLLAERVVEAAMWAASEPDIADLPLGLFGSSTGAAAALVAASELKGRVAAVVSRGGRPDLAGEHLPAVTAPTLLVVGGKDFEVLEMNELAHEALTAEKKLSLVAGAGHLFEEPGTLEASIGHAAEWFEKYLVSVEGRVASPAPRIVPSDLSILRAAAEPLPDINDDDFAAAFDRFGDRRVVLLGESTHGTSEFYRARAAITRRLIERHGFNLVAVEADWPDAAAVDRHVRQSPHRPMETPPFTRFPAWMWRNAEFEAFTGFLRQHNGTLEPDRRVAFYGLDLYNMNASIDAVLGYLDRVDSAAARVARNRYACLSPWSREPAAYGRAALTHGFALCAKPVTEILLDLLNKQLEYAAKDGVQFFDAAQNARLVASAERYYRAMYYGSHISWNLRDRHMFETLDQILANAGPGGKAVVWAHNSHVGDARSSDMGRERGELNIGQLCREAYGGAAALIGFGTGTGTVAAASEWDAPMEIKTLRPVRPDSCEDLCHRVGVERFLFDFGKPGNAEMRKVMSASRLERYIGVIYRPETERASHYSHATLSDQYDAFVWFDETGAVTPLATLARKGEDETYPFGL